MSENQELQPQPAADPSKLINVDCDRENCVVVDFAVASNGFRMTPEGAIELADHLVAFAEIARFNKRRQESRTT